MRTFCILIGQVSKLQKMRIRPFQIIFFIFSMSKLNFETPAKIKHHTKSLKLQVGGYLTYVMLHVGESAKTAAVHDFIQ